jgi:hypothetical protein
MLRMLPRVLAQPQIAVPDGKVSVAEHPKDHTADSIRKEEMVLCGKTASDLVAARNWE